MSTITDLDIEHALDGDDAATGELVAALLPVIRRRVARALVGRGSGAGLGPEIEDLTQEVLLALFANDRRILKAWSPERGLPFEKFIGLVARRRVLSILHSQRRNPFNAEPTDPADLDSQPPSRLRCDVHRSIETRQSLARLSDALRNRLSPTGLDMFRRLFAEEQSVSDISANTGLSSHSVYQWRTRIKKAAREWQSSVQARGAVRSG